MRVMKNFYVLVLTLALALSMSIVSSAAPYVNDNGVIVDDLLPACFTDGYVYANHATYNSPAEENGLGGTYVWFEGMFDSLIKVGDSPTVTFAIVTDLEGNEWLVGLDAEIYTSDDVFVGLYNKPLAIAGCYEGFSSVYQLPNVFCTKICDISTGQVWSSTMSKSVYTDMPNDAGTSNTLVNIASSLSGRYYMTENLSTYRPHLFIDVVGNSGGSITYNQSIVGITTDNAVASYYSSDDVAYYYDGTNMFGFSGSLLMIEYPTGKIYMFVKP